MSGEEPRLEPKRAFGVKPGGEPSETAVSPKGMAKEISSYLEKVDALSTALLPLYMTAAATEIAARRRLMTFFEKYCEPIPGEREGWVSVPVERVRRGQKLRKEIESAKFARRCLPRTTLVALVGEFDVYFGRLLRALYVERQELFGERATSFSARQLLELGSIEKAVESIFAIELDQVLRLPYSEQVDWLAERFKIPDLKQDLDWKTFVEITERRHLLIHCNGEVSSQYLAVCRREKIDLPSGLKVGDELEVPHAYFYRAAQCLYRFGFKLGQEVWRKALPGKLGDADGHLNEVTLELLSEGRGRLAKELLQYSSRFGRKGRQESQMRVALVNLAQALRWTGEVEECKRLLSEQDWTACEPKFKLAVAVLSDDYETASQIVREMGPKGPVDKTDFLQWPLFRDFRLQPEFPALYNEVFGCEPAFEEEDPSRGREEAILEELKSLMLDDEGEGSESNSSNTQPDVTDEA